MQDVDVRLIGTLYTRSLARRYLATTLANKWYPYNCFQLICELLYGRVPCYVTYTRDVVDDGSKVNAKDQDLVLSKVSSLPRRFSKWRLVRRIRLSPARRFERKRGPWGRGRGDALCLETSVYPLYSVWEKSILVGRIESQPKLLASTFLGMNLNPYVQKNG